MGDILRLVVIVIVGPLLALAFVTWILHFFVGLTAPPIKRAAWTVAIAYPVVALICASAVPAEYWWWAPVVPIPGALIIFTWWLIEFRRGWIDADAGEEGVALANDDWRFGLIIVASIIGFMLFRALFRLVSQGSL
jgi:hypothetical protein